jgi:transcriptional regulator with XRE-family HTH domain
MSVNMNTKAYQFLSKCAHFPKNVYNCNMSDEAVVKRIKVIVKEHGGQLALANAIGVDQGFISKVINQKQDISYYLIRKLCFQLKYSPEWLILGTGDKIIHKPDSAKLITEIQMLRTEVDILHARMRAYDLQLQEIKEQGLTGKQKAG